MHSNDVISNLRQIYIKLVWWRCNMFIPLVIHSGAILKSRVLNVFFFFSFMLIFTATMSIIKCTLSDIQWWCCEGNYFSLLSVDILFWKVNVIVPSLWIVWISALKLKKIFLNDMDIYRVMQLKKLCISYSFFTEFYLN